MQESNEISASLEDDQYSKPEFSELPDFFEKHKYSSNGIYNPTLLPILFLFGFFTSSIIIALIYGLQFVTLWYGIKPMHLGNFSGFLGLIVLVLYGSIGAVCSGYLSRIGAKLIKCRNIKVTTTFGFINAYAGCLLWPSIIINLVSDSGGGSPWLMVFILGGVGGLFFAGIAAGATHFFAKGDTFCETCDKYYTKAETLFLDVTSINDLIQIITTGNRDNISLINFAVPKENKRKIALAIQKCLQCDDSNIRLTATVHYQEIVYSTVSKKNVEMDREEEYFDIFFSTPDGDIF